MSREPLNHDTNMANCREIETQLSLLMDNALSAGEGEAVRAHLDTCDSCRGVLIDLERINRAARGLGAITPPDHIWLELAGQVRLEPGLLPSSQGSQSPAPSRAALAQWIGLAAALVLITLGAFYFLREMPAPIPASTSAGNAAGNAAAAGTVEAVSEELSLAMQHYERAIAELETLAKSDTSALDPSVATTLRQNIRTIDQAIAESRVALTDNPASEPARDSLFEALRRKVVVLQATVTLMNEMRNGNQGGAADAAAGLGKKG